jgi:hypothetical protein
MTEFRLLFSLYLYVERLVGSLFGLETGLWKSSRKDEMGKERECILDSNVAGLGNWKKNFAASTRVRCRELTRAKTAFSLSLSLSFSLSQPTRCHSDLSSRKTMHLAVRRFSATQCMGDKLT